MNGLDETPVTPGASDASARLLSYLCHTAGVKIITGQHTQTNEMEEIGYIKNVTGKEPKMRGFELLSYSPNINYKDASEACLKEVTENRGTADTAVLWGLSTIKNKTAAGSCGVNSDGGEHFQPSAEVKSETSIYAAPSFALSEAHGEDNAKRNMKLSSGRTWNPETDGIVTLTWHWFSPMYGRDKSFYSENTPFDPERVLKTGTDERKHFFSDMDVIAGQLEKFQKADIPVLWRPFHESGGTWFWWGRKGPAAAKELYLLMFDYFTKEKHLDNLLWVWNCGIKEGYPGDNAVDVITADIYLDKYIPTDYKDDYISLVRETTEKKVAALGETGCIPDPDVLQKSHVPWAYYMCWSKEFCIGEKYNSNENLKRMYESPYSLTL